MRLCQLSSLSNIRKKQSYDYELIAQSYHESGHAVCALHNYMKVINVDVMNERSNNDGKTEYLSIEIEELGEEDIQKAILYFDLQIYYAGLVAEKLYYKDICGSDQFPMHLRIGSSNDLYNASEIIKKSNFAAAGKERFLFKKKVQKEVNDLLIKYWSDVKLVAHYLYKKKKLNFDELKNILTRKSENKDFWKTRFKVMKIIHDTSTINELDLYDIFII